MGLTGFSYEIFKKYAKSGDSILELGNQTIYFGDSYGQPAKYMFEKLGYHHVSIDKNGKDGVISSDLSKKHDYTMFNNGKYDLVTDFGTSEHVKDFFICWHNKHFNCRIGGYIISENPKTGNWAGHGHHYLTKDFYIKLAEITDCEIMVLGEHPAMQNTTDGWNIYCVLKKTKKGFMSREQFDKLAITTK